MTFLTTPLFAALLSFGPLPSLEVRASFDTEAAAWAATDVIVVSEGEAVDGRVTVIEAWLGGVEAGTELAFEILEHYRSDGSRSVKTGLFASERDPVERVTGGQMVLFLDRDAHGTLRLLRGLEDEGEESIAWLEAGRVFARFQALNPGGNEIQSLGATAHEFQGQVERIVALRDGMDAIEAFTDPLVRVMAIAPHVYDVRRFVKDRAFEIIVESGPTGFDYLRRLALNLRIGNQDLDLAPRVVKALSQFPPEALVPTLNEMLEAELEYWTRTGLPEARWAAWDAAPGGKKYRLSRYARLNAILRALDVSNPTVGTEAFPELGHALKPDDLSPAYAAVAAFEALFAAQEERPEASRRVHEQLRRILASRER